MNQELTVGTLCVTVNSDHPACNDGALVVIVEINHSMKSARGASVPYLIRRVDGQRHVSTHDSRTGETRWFRCADAWCAGYKLKPVGDSAQQDAHVNMVQSERGPVPA